MNFIWRLPKPSPSTPSVAPPPLSATPTLSASSPHSTHAASSAPLTAADDLHNEVVSSAPTTSGDLALKDEHDPIIHNATFCVHICTTHETAVFKLKQHLRDKHQLSLRRRQAIVAAHRDEPVVPFDQVPFPNDVVDPVPGLRPPFQALHCRGDGCRFSCRQLEWMRRHAHEQHQWSRSPEVPVFWDPIFAQTFMLRRGYVKLFEVNFTPPVSQTSPVNRDHHGSRRISPALLSTNDLDDLSKIQQQWTTARQHHEQTLATMDEETMKQDRTGWYNHTGWPEHLAKRNLKHLAHASRLPDRDETLLQEGVRTLNMLLDRAVGGLASLDPELRRWLRSAKRADPDVRPMARLQDPNSQDRYHGYMRRFLCLCLRVHMSLNAVHTTTSNVAEDTAEDASDGTTNDDDSDDENTDADSTDDAVAGGDEESDVEPARAPVTDVMKDARELFPWVGEQRVLVETLVQELERPDTTATTAGESVSVDDEQKMAKMLAVFRAFIFHKIAGRRYQSALVHFLAVLGIDDEKHRLRRASDFSYMLAGVVYCLRVLGAEILLPASRRSEQEGDEEVREQFLGQRQQFLADGTGTPFSIMTNWLAYSKYIAMNTGNSGSVNWSRDKQTLYFRGRPVPLTRFRTMIHDAIGRAEDLLWKKLMWVTNRAERWEVPLHSIIDDVTFTRRGISFLSKSSNGLGDGLDWMLRRLLMQPEEDRLRVHGRWHLPRVRRYLRHMDDFLQLLLFCVHTTGGQPGRGTEVTVLRFQNGCLQDRNVFIIDGQVVFVTRYHKSQSQWDRPKVIPRFLPPRVQQMLVVYLACCQRLREHLLVETEGQGFSDHIWHGNKGPWDTDRLTKVIRRETSSGLGHGYTTLDYRHIAVSIGRVTVGASFASGYKDEIGEVEEAEVEEESALDVQSGRGEIQGGLKYGVPIDIIAHLSARSLETFRPLSEAWHRFLGLQEGSEQVDQSTAPAIPSGSLKRSHVALHDETRQPRRTLAAQDNIISSTLLTTVDTPSPASADRVGDAMRQLFQTDQVCFRSREQEEGVYAVVRGETPVVVVLPTGGGKTVLAMVPALMNADEVTIVVAPFRALVDDMVKRFRRANIDCLEWHSGERNAATVVVVSADVAASYGFLSYASLLRQQGSLRRIFIDECHLTFTASEWRPKLWQVRQLRTLQCPMYLLTATLPPLLAFDLEDTMLIRNARIIRASTVRAQHRYHVQRCRVGNLLSEAIQLCQRRRRHLRGFKGVVYCRSRATCEMMAEELNCPYYHAQSVDRGERLSEWMERGGLIVATSALGTGVDIPGIAFVLHVDMPWSMIDFAQESGRAGRGGEVVDSVILVEEKSVETRVQRQMLSTDVSAMAEFIMTRECRRQVMSAYLDGAELGRGCEEVDNSARCDNCGEGVTEADEDERVRVAQWEAVRQALDDMATGCVWCWVENSHEAGDHSTARCPVRRAGAGRAQAEAAEQLRRMIVYERGSHSCTRCGMSQKLCASGLDNAAECQWPQVVAPLLWRVMEHALTEPLLRRLGYEGTAGESGDLKWYARWVGQRHVRRYWGEWMSNGMVVAAEFVRWLLEMVDAEPESGGRGGG